MSCLRVSMATKIVSYILAYIMNKLLPILALLCFGLAQNEIQNNEHESIGGMGLSFNNNITSLHLSTVNTGIDFGFNIFGGYFSYWEDIDNGNYEDMTSVFGTVNTYNDRFDGLFPETSYLSLGFYPIAFWHKNKKESNPKESTSSIVLAPSIGYSYTSQYFYQKLYDSSEILGNNGKYYIESSETANRHNYIELGINLWFRLKPKQKEEYFSSAYYIHIGYSFAPIIFKSVGEELKLNNFVISIGTQE